MAKPYKLIRLDALALTRDGLDRFGPLGNVIWLAAALFWSTWAVFATWFVITSLFKGVRLDIGSWVWGGFITLVLGAALAGLIDRVVRIAAGLIGTFVSAFGLYFLGAVCYAAYKTSNGNLLSPEMLIVDAVLLVAILIMLHAFAFSLGLVVFGRDTYWNVLRESEVGEKSRLTLRLAYLLGVGQSGIYADRWRITLMLIVRLLGVIGLFILGWSLFLVFAYGVLGSAAHPGSARFQALSDGGKSLAAGAACLLLSYVLTLAFRVLTRRPRIEREAPPAGDFDLFLRSFRDDTVRFSGGLNLNPLPASLITPRSLDEALLARDPSIVAVGKPRDRDAPLGAKRLYYDDAEWQERIVSLIDRTRTVFICLDDTQGVAWEFDQILRRGHAAKTRFIVHPKASPALTLDWLARLGVEVPAKVAATVIGFDCPDGQTMRLFTGQRTGPAYRVQLGWMCRP